MDPQPDIHDFVAPYALGALDGADRTRFERHLFACERCRGELPGLQGAASALAFDVDQSEPPDSLRRRIMLAARLNQPEVAGAVPLLRRRWTLPAAAAVATAAACAAIGLGIWAVSLSGDLDSERRAVAILADPAATRYPLVGARGHIVVTRARDAALVVSNLRRAPHGRTYELWVVAASQPAPAGLFHGGGRTTLIRLTRKVPPGAQVAVSLEPAGGSRRLTGSPLFEAQTT